MKRFFSKKYTTILDNQTIPLKYLYKSILDKIGVKIIKRDYKILLHQNIKKINKNCEFIIGIGKGGLINKLVAAACLNFEPHKGTLSTYNEQVEIIKNQTKILQVKKNIFFLTDIYYARFNN